MPSRRVFLTPEEVGKRKNRGSLGPEKDGSCRRGRRLQKGLGEIDRRNGGTSHRKPFLNMEKKRGGFRIGGGEDDLHRRLRERGDHRFCVAKKKKACSKKGGSFRQRKACRTIPQRSKVKGDSL